MPAKKTSATDACVLQLSSSSEHDSRRGHNELVSIMPTKMTKVRVRLARALPARCQPI